jgi:hypothetical protein
MKAASLQQYRINYTVFTVFVNFYLQFTVFFAKRKRRPEGRRLGL